ncbi:hypothetical protein BGZ96_001789 [Linnemannia gamsii]|uniref:G-protein coupled receptors family 3 profile domain-containing protein n=1 Tax=Linnemannia gamsii TaxID=64522 RepID=A0ABQ7KBK9_9FUNG|nr:hypothetical protein BGZ96_001789 [Linnemannia gamsii]
MNDVFPTHSTIPLPKTPPKSPSVPLKLSANPTLPTFKEALIDLDHITGDDHGSTYDPPYRIPGLTQEEYEETWDGEPDTIKIGVLLPFTPNVQFPYMTPLSRISLSVGGVIGDIASDLTTAEAIMTSSIGVPQCSFASYNMDTTVLANFVYLFRTVPGVTKYVEALALVVKYYKWTKVSIMHTSDIPGIIGEKAFSAMCASSDVEIMRFPIPLPQGKDILEVARSVIRSVKDSDTRIHVLAAPRAVQIQLLEAIRDIGLFHHDHVWMTTIDLTDSLSKLTHPQDFNGLIMADALWAMPGIPEFDQFVANWQILNQEQYPMSGSSQLTWHETFAYTCIQVLAEAYKDLVANAMTLTNETQREQLLLDIRQGRRSQDLTMKFMGMKNYSTPIGRFSVTKAGEPIKLPISISTFQNGTSVPNDLNPSISSPFGITIVFLTSLLMMMIIITAIIVVVFRENIVIKSASPLFCTLELFGLAVTLSWIYLRVDLPSPVACRMGLSLVVVGLSINLSALVVKNYRIYRIFNSVSVINHAVSNRYLLRVVTIPVVITIIPSLIRCFYNYLIPILIRTNDNEYWVTCDCQYSTTLWDILVIAMPIIINIFGIYLAFKTRNVTRLWNEARSIAITIYLVSFFVIIIIIVQSFPLSMFKVTYYVTIASVFLASLMEYIILFYPKLRNLFLQQRGFHVAAGREDDGMDSILGGVSAALGAGAGRSNGRGLNAATLLDGGGDGGSGAGRFGERRFGSAGDLLGGGGTGAVGSMQGSVSSADMKLQQQLQQQQHQLQNPDISDLVSSYPFGQLNSDGSAMPMISPVHRPDMYEPSSTLTNRGGKKSGGGGDGSDQEGGIGSTRLLDVHRATSRSTGSNGGVGGTATKPVAIVGAVAGSGGVIPPVKGYDTFVRDVRNSRDSQPVDINDVLMESSNSRRSKGNILSVSGYGVGGGQDMSMYDYLGTSVASDRGPSNSRNSSVVEYDAFGMINRLRTGNRSPKLYPLQTNYTGTNGPYGLQSSRHPLRERRTDSYTVTAPVQRQRWYVVQFLAQWRMSKIIFVPYSKLLVMVDLETERSESLIVHTIEKGYSASDYWTTTEEALHINTNIYPTDSLIPSADGGGQTLQLPPIKAQHLPQRQQQQRERSTLSPSAHPTAAASSRTGGGGQSQIKPILASNQVHPIINNSSNINQDITTRPSLTDPEMSYQLSDDTVLAPLDDGHLMPPLPSAAIPLTTTIPETISPLHRDSNLTGGAASGRATLASSIAGGVAPEAGAAGTGVEVDGMTTGATRITIAPGAAGGPGLGPGSGAGGDMEEGGSNGSFRRRIGSISGFNSGVRRMSQFLGLPARHPLDGPTPTTTSKGVKFAEGESSDMVDDTQQQVTNGIEQGVISEHIIRVVSIHNEVWRVQLPDEETMERWIEIGQQIKDENWISRPLTIKSSGDIGGKKFGSAGNGGNSGGGARMNRGRSGSGDSSGGGGGRGLGGGGGVNASSPEDKYEFAQRPRRPTQMQQHSFHPLQPIPTSTSLGTGSHFDHQLQPTTIISSSAANSSTVKRYNPMRFDSDMTEASATNTFSSQDTEQKQAREQVREQAARVNQEMRATTRYVPPLIRGLFKLPQQQSQTSLGRNSPRLEGSESSLSGSPRSSSLGTRVRIIPSSLKTAPISAASQRFGAGSRQNSRSFLGDQQLDPLSAQPVTPSQTRHRLSESFLPTLSSPSSPVTTPDVPRTTDGNRSSDETSIGDILAETNVSYNQGQHAVYKDPSPGHEHRGHRHFNTLQYNYDRHRSSSASGSTHAHAIRRKKLAMLQRRRRSGGSIGTVGTASGGEGFYEDDLDLELELELDMALDFEHLELHRAAGSSPESPQWHMTSMEVAKMEAENLRRNRLHAEGGVDGLGAMMAGGGGGGVDDMRSTGNGGSGNNVTTAHTISGPTRFTTTSTSPSPGTSYSAPASTSPTPRTLSPTKPTAATPTCILKGPKPISGNLIPPLLGGTKFSRFSPGVPTVSFSDLPDQEFPWQRWASTPVTNPVMSYSPPPPEPGYDEYHSTTPKQQDPTSTFSGGDAPGGAAVIPPGGRETTPPSLERLQSLSPAIMHVPPPSMESRDSHEGSDDVVDLGTLPPPSNMNASSRPLLMGVQAPLQAFSPSAQGELQSRIENTSAVRVAL